MSAPDAPNFMQRVFDTLKASPELLSVAQLASLTRIDGDSIRSALSRLRDARALTTAYREGNWTYGVRAKAERPRDNRGRRKVDRIV